MPGAGMGTDTSHILDGKTKRSSFPQPHTRPLEGWKTGSLWTTGSFHRLYSQGSSRPLHKCDLLFTAPFRPPGKEGSPWPPSVAVFQNSSIAQPRFRKLSPQATPPL